ncbi:MAG: VWA domain-containing protein [Polyangiales bacterium]
MAVRIWVTLSALTLLASCSSSSEPPATTLADDDSGQGLSPDVGLGNDDAASNFDIGSSDAPVASDDTSCAATTEKATAVPLDIFVMQDQSGSMKDATSTGSSKWDAVKAAMKSFLADKKSEGLGVGIQYFGQMSSGHISCNVADYAKAEVEIAPLPGVRAAIEASLDAHSPNGNTPTAPALQGALKHAQAWSAANPTHTVVVVLATDGMPTSCAPTDIPSIAAFASTASSGKPAIRTYVIGVLSKADVTAGGGANLDAISKAGNGAPAFIVDASGTVTAEFGAALEKIRGASLACEYEVPKGAGADYAKVNVAVTLGGKSSVIPYVGSAAACDPSKGGWYYDVAPTAGTPTKIIMCDATCKALESDPAGSIDIQVGCSTLVK